MSAFEEELRQRKELRDLQERRTTANIAKLPEVLEQARSDLRSAVRQLEAAQVPQRPVASAHKQRRNARIATKLSSGWWLGEQSVLTPDARLAFGHLVSTDRRSADSITCICAERSDDLFDVLGREQLAPLAIASLTYAEGIGQLWIQVARRDGERTPNWYQQEFSGWLVSQVSGLTAAFERAR